MHINLRRLFLFWVPLALIAFYVITQPVAAATQASNLGAHLKTAANSLVTFVVNL